VICTICKLPIQYRYFKVSGYHYHPECVRCGVCRRQVDEHYSFENGILYHPSCFQKKKGLICEKCGDILGPKWMVHEKKNYHKACLEPLITEKCSYCEKGLVGRYYIDPWGQKVHAAHRLSACDTCHRYLIKRSDANRLGDGRYQCSSCYGLGVRSPSDLHRIYLEVMGYLHSMNIKGFPQHVPVSMLDLSAMKRVSRSHSDNPKGLTKTHIRKTGAQRALTHEIFVLYGLPRIEFKGVLAHELMHVWLHEHNIKLSSAQTEGLCNLATFFVYSQERSILAKYLLDAMKKNPDPIYGQGYRSMLAHVKSRGWQAFLNDLMENKNLNKSLWRRIFGK